MTIEKVTTERIIKFKSKVGDWSFDVTLNVDNVNACNALLQCLNELIEAIIEESVK